MSEQRREKALGPSIRLGSIEITRIPEWEGWGAGPAALFPRFERSVLDEHRSWMTPSFWDPIADRLYTSFHTWLVRTPELTILVDTCAGNHKPRPNNPRFDRLCTPFLGRLAAAGVGPADVDVIVCTHLHVDHCGWNTMLVDGRWVPTFPRARHVFSRTECEFCEHRALEAHPGDLEEGVFQDSVHPILASGQATLVNGIHEIAEGIDVVPSPGHTPGHIMVRIRSLGLEGLFTGDIMHHPLQVLRPDWNSQYCIDPDTAITTRLSVLRSAADREVILFPAHFGTPYCGRIAFSDDSFRFLSGLE